MAIELTTGEFNDFIKDGNVLIDFYADWCMPCVMMGPVIDDLSEKFKGKIKVGKVNVDDSQKIAQKYNIASIPNFVILKDGKVVAQFTGSMSEEELENKIKKYL